MLCYRSVDEGCNNIQPALCGINKKTREKICKKTYEECNAFEGCTDPQYPFLCSNGECAKNFYYCEEKFFNCDKLKYCNKYAKMY